MLTNVKHRLRPLVADLTIGDSGWASRSLSRSIRQITFAMVAGWQLVMLLAVVAATGLSAWPLLLAHALFAALVILAPPRATTLLVWPVPVAMAGLGVIDHLVGGDLDSVLVLAACWQINFANCAAGLLISRWQVVPGVILGSAAISALIAIALPQWGPALPISIIVTQTSIIIAIRLGLPFLLALARRADRAEDAAQQATHRAEVMHRVIRQVSEEARVLHDTAINTLGAIANGGAGTADLTQVRDQCARDVVLLDALRRERAADRRAGSRPSPRLQDIFCLPRSPIQRHGLDDEELNRCAEHLDEEMISGLVRAATEAITNAAKHSGAPIVQVSIGTPDGQLVIEIRDDGVGFDSETVELRGLSGSIVERARDCGFEAQLRTAPGEGTTVTLSAALAGRPTAPAEEPSGEDVQKIVYEIHRRAGLAWGAGATVVSVVLTAAGGANRYFALYGMIAVMTVTWLAARYAVRRTLGPWASGLFALATIGVFVLSAAATGFGTDGAFHWQALAATCPFILLMSYQLPARTIRIAGCAWALVVSIMAAVVWIRFPVGAAHVIVAGCVGITFALVWSRFQTAVTTLSIESATAGRQAFAAQLSADAEKAAQETYRRWLEAGLDSAIGLLEAISQGRRDPQRYETRLACSEEEAYLRQLVLVTPELVHLGGTMMPLLRMAREQQVPLTLRLGGRDASDEATARAVSSAIRNVLATASADQKVTASVFPVHDGLQLTITRTGAGPGPLKGSVALATRPSEAPQLLQLTFPDSGTPHSQEPPHATAFQPA